MPSAKRYPLPNEVSSAVESQKVSNFGLLFHRYIAYQDDWKLEGTEKSNTWKAIERNAQGIFPKMEKLSEAVQHRLSRLERGYQQRFGPQGVQSFTAAVDWRLAIGFSTPSVMDTGISLHRIYGIPYLPGSAVKGLTRHFQLMESAEKLGVPILGPEAIKKRKKNKRDTPWETLEQLLMAKSKDQASLLQRLKNDDAVKGAAEDADDSILRIPLPDLRARYIEPFLCTFGSTTRKGEVTFFDAFPQFQSKVFLELDIINTHYQEYYTEQKDSTGKKTPPADYLNPNPVFFLTVPKDTQFHFLLAAQDSSLLRTVVCWLQTALQEFGIGAKTMAGYGAMTAQRTSE